MRAGGQKEVGEMADLNSNTTKQTKQAAAETAKIANEATEAYAAATQETLEKFDMAVPEAFRSAAEQAVTQSREAYERSKDAMEDTVEMMEQSIDKAGKGSAEINRKVIGMMQSNLNSGFDLAKNMAGAKNFAEILECQATFARKQFETFASQAEEIRELSTKVASDASEPFKAHMTRSMESLKTH